MSPDAQQRLGRWLTWLGDEPTDEQLTEAMARWERGVEPPSQPMPLEWPKDET